MEANKFAVTINRWANPVVVSVVAILWIVLLFVYIPRSTNTIQAIWLVIGGATCLGAAISGIQYALHKVEITKFNWALTFAVIFSVTAVAWALKR